jgi:hypothetical protein
MADANKHRLSVAQRNGTIGPVGRSCLAVETVMDTGMSTTRQSSIQPTDVK